MTNSNFVFTTLNNRQATLVGVETWSSSNSHYSNNSQGRVSALLCDSETGRNFSVPVQAVVEQLVQQGLVALVNPDTGVKHSKKVEKTHQGVYKSGPSAHDEVVETEREESWSYNSLVFLTLQEYATLTSTGKVGELDACWSEHQSKFIYSQNLGFDLWHILELWTDVVKKADKFDEVVNSSHRVVDPSNKQFMNYLELFGLESWFDFPSEEWANSEELGTYEHAFPHNSEVDKFRGA